ncbi:MAG TPA: ribonuclease H-like domain-containing protein [Candidatus Limnocylindrales bacterium]|nr:ribonuclease H-like domain-containing protein [Candidatus Limnocylindrales bacterium]
MAPEIPLGSERLADLLGAVPAANRFGEHLGLRRWFSEAIDSEPPANGLDEAVLRLLVPEAPACVADPRQWLFLDTETTGLAGGTGTYPFLVGIAWWDAGGLEVQQLFMRDHSEEYSLLLALAERMAERPVLVTFNGKAFDWPLLDTRYRMTRRIRVPEPSAHLDFLHPARNLWRLRLGSVRLAELERHVLGWDRGADVMSEFIPSIYFEFLRGGSPDPLVPIFHHNQMDLRGLAGLASHTLSLLAEPEARGRDALELFGVSRICERRGETGRARTLYQASIARELPEETGRAARRSLARIAKRDGDFAFACELWSEMLDESREGLEAYEQLAIHYERRSREPARAAAFVRKALAGVRRASRTGRLAPAVCQKFQQRFEARLARLERKAARAATGFQTTLAAESNPPAPESN